jgi:hypothetical protein
LRDLIARVATGLRFVKSDETVTLEVVQGYGGSWDRRVHAM